MNIDTLKEWLEYRSDGNLIWKKSRSRASAGSVFGCSQGTGYIQGGFFGKRLYAHRLIWALHHNKMPEAEIDHINGNPLDNRIENLREVSRYNNSVNRHKVRSDSKAGVMGVQKFRNKWRARITVDGNVIRLGHFETMQDAHEAYMKAKENYHTNFVRAY